MKHRLQVAAIGLALLLVPTTVTAVGNAFVGALVFQMVLWALLCIGWSVLASLTGEISFGHALFFGIGAYSVVLVSKHLGVSPWFGLVLGAVLAALLSAAIAFVTFRFDLRGVFYSFTTLAIAMAVYGVTGSLDWIGGRSGIVVLTRSGGLANLQFVSKTPYVLIVSVALALSLGGVYCLQRSRFGYFLLAIKSDYDAAKAVGINVVGMRIFAAAISGLIAAVAGSFRSQYILFVDPASTLNWTVSIQTLVMVVVGGLSKPWHALVGVILIAPLPNIIQLFFPTARPGAYLFVYGMVLILVLRFIPKGVGDLVERGALAVMRRLNLRNERAKANA